MINSVQLDIHCEPTWHPTNTGRRNNKYPRTAVSSHLFAVAIGDAVSETVVYTVYTLYNSSIATPIFLFSTSTNSFNKYTAVLVCCYSNFLIYRHKDCSQPPKRHRSRNYFESSSEFSVRLCLVQCALT